MEKLLAVFELEKAVYELRYDLNNRPGWVDDPGRRDPAPARDRGPGVTRSGAALTSNPHGFLGAHPADGGVTVRVLRPEAESCGAEIGLAPGDGVELEHVGEGVWEGLVPGVEPPFDYVLRVAYPGGEEYTVRDPYLFLPTLGYLDPHLITEGCHEQIYRRLGAHPMKSDGVTDTSFAVWAPNARRRARRRRIPLPGRTCCTRCSTLGSSPALGSFSSPTSPPGAALQVRDPRSRPASCRLKADPFRASRRSFRRRRRPSCSREPRFSWRDDAWIASAARRRAAPRAGVDL